MATEALSLSLPGTRIRQVTRRVTVVVVFRHSQNVRSNKGENAKIQQSSPSLYASIYD